MDSPLFPTHADSAALLRLSSRQRSALSEWVGRGLALISGGLLTAATVHWRQADIGQKTGIPVVEWVEPQDRPHPTSVQELYAHTLRLPGDRVIFDKDAGNGCILLSRLSYSQEPDQSTHAATTRMHMTHNRAYNGLEEGLHTLQLAIGRYLSRAFRTIPFDLKSNAMAEADIAETMLDHGCPIPLNFLSPENGYTRGDLITHKPPYPTTKFPLIYEAYWPWIDSTSEQLSRMPVGVSMPLGRNENIRVDCSPGELPDVPYAQVNKLAPDQYQFTLVALPDDELSIITGYSLKVLRHEDLGNPQAKPVSVDKPHQSLIAKSGDWVSLNDTVMFEIPPPTGFTYTPYYEDKRKRRTMLAPHLGNLIQHARIEKIQDVLRHTVVEMGQQQEQRQRKKRYSRLHRHG